MSSIFGQPKSVTPNPFGKLGSPSSSGPEASAPGGSIFGNLGTQPQQQPSLFPSLAAQPPLGTTPGGSSLGANTLGGSTLGGSTLRGSTLGGGTLGGRSSLFENRQSTTTQPQPFGSSLFGPGRQDQNQLRQSQPREDGKTPQAPGYFNTLLEKNKKRVLDTGEGHGLDQVPSLQLGLGDIAKRVRELGGVGTQTQRGKTFDSKAHYLLAASGVNPESTLDDLNRLSTQVSSTAHVQAPPDWDPDTHRYIEQMQQRSTLKMINEGIDRAHREFDAYLEENIEINWADQRKKIYEHFGLTPRGATDPADSIDHLAPGGKGSFGRSSQRGRQGNTDRPGHSSLSRSMFTNSAMQKSVIGAPGKGAGNGSLLSDVSGKDSAVPAVRDDRFLREKQGKFAEKVIKLNEARLQGNAYPVLREFAQVESQPGAESPSQLAAAYEALVEIVREDQTMDRTSAGEERQYADDYLEELPQSKKAIEMRKTILNGSRRALEKHFEKELGLLVARNPREASLGGIPSIVNRVRAYIRIRHSRKDLAPDGIELQMLNDDYCWALIFFLLRCGHVEEAADYVATNANPFRTFDRNFIIYITTYAKSPDRRLNRSQQDKINSEFQQRSRIAPDNSLDPYRMACYKVIGRCELSKRSLDNVGQGVEDWIWLQFNLAREVNRVEEPASEVFGLDEIRETVIDIGQKHFSAGSEGLGGYGTFFYLQILAGMFERAVAYLYTYSYIAAVHFAIALDFYGLLRVSDFMASESELLTHNTKELPQINFGRMIGFYTRDFRAVKATAAVDYLTLICLNADLPGALGKSQSSLCHEALRELVLETREFSDLLGDVRSDGTRIKGAIEHRLQLIKIADQEAFLKTVTLHAASVADDSGRTTDAVLLYHLAEDYENVITIVSRALSEAVAVEMGEEQMRLQPLKPRTIDPKGKLKQVQGSSLSLTTVDDPAELARNMVNLYNSNALYYQKIRSDNRDTCGLLLQISDAKARVVAERWAEALDIITSLSLLPLNASGSIPNIRSHAQNLATFRPTISRLIGPLLLWTMTCISRQRELLLGETNGQGSFENETRRSMRDDLLVKAKDLMTFAGLVKLRLGKGIWDGIVGGAGEIGAF